MPGQFHVLFKKMSPLSLNENQPFTFIPNQ